MSLHKWLSTGSIYLNVERDDKHADVRSNKNARNKYGPALKHFLPYRSPPADSRAMPSNSAGLFSYVAVSWMTKLMIHAYKYGLKQDDFYELQECDRAEPNAFRLENMWNEHVKENDGKSSLSRVVWQFCRTRCIIAMIFMVLAVIFQFMGPAVIQHFMLEFVKTESQPLWQGYCLVLALFICQILRNYCFGAGYVMGLTTAIRVQGAMQQLVYKKMLMLRSGGDRVLGQILTFCTNEQERLFEACHMGVLMLGTPIMFVMSVIYSLLVLGPWALLGNLVILLFYPIMGGIAKLTSKVRIQTVKVTDQRVSLMSEILNSIRLIKMYAWENSFTNKIASVRDIERKQLQKAAFLQSFSNTVTPAITVLASVLTFLGYSLTGHNLYATEAFTVFAVFTAMQFTVGTLPYGIKCLAEANVSCKKIQNFLHRPNYKPPMSKCLNDDMIHIKDGTFAWETQKEDDKIKKKNHKKKLNSTVNVVANGETVEEKRVFIPNDESQPIVVLNNVTLSIKQRTLVGICGSVGAGKSSLLSAIMGEMLVVSGDVKVSGSIAIVSQQAWIFNDTVRENILFGLPFQETTYQEIVNCCSLKRDLELFINGDKTEIGERGTNLSGGQKQRINLARAVYADKDIYLLDDPLSAVDAKVARDIFMDCIKSKLQSKTVILVTHGLQFLEQCDEILYMKDGAIAERGTHQELVEQKGDYYQMLQFDQTRDKKGIEQNIDSLYETVNKIEETDKAETNGKLTSEEEHKMSHTGYHAYLHYAKFCGGYCIFMSLLFLVLLFTLCRLSSGIWLQIWLDKGDGKEV